MYNCGLDNVNHHEWIGPLPQVPKQVKHILHMWKLPSSGHHCCLDASRVKRPQQQDVSNIETCCTHTVGEEESLCSSRSSRQQQQAAARMAAALRTVVSARVGVASIVLSFPPGEESCG